MGTLSLDVHIFKKTNRYVLFRPVLKDEPLRAYFQGLEYMNDDPNAVDVLYAKVELEDESDRFVCIFVQRLS